MHYIRNMKRICIKREGKPAIWAEETAPFTYRLTCCGKPYSVGDSLIEAVANGTLKEKIVK